MVATWFAIRSCNWRKHAHVLYPCTCGTVGFYFAFWYSEGGIGSVSSGMMWDAHWGGRLGDYPVWKDMPPFGYTLGGGAGDASGVAYGVSNLRGDVGAF